jgi:hypothetical protein
MVKVVKHGRAYTLPDSSAFGRVSTQYIDVTLEDENKVSAVLRVPKQSERLFKIGSELTDYRIVARQDGNEVEPL